ncbi:hypothetical protein AB0H07_39105 [Streptomyces sp. NPDC021354]|uniref:hypothetical protein n=1 Tax=Streptomyces sp. NPDC021354 TaxID=3154793 RepID=UPI0033CFBB80
MISGPLRPADPASGYHRITAERRFRYLAQDPARPLRVVWLALPVTCPMCAEDTGLTLTYDQAADDTVQALCLAGHAWPEPLIQASHFITYSQLQAGLAPHPDTLWIMDAGFGLEPPPPIDYVADIKAGWGYGLKYAKRRAKSKVKAAVRKPIRQARKKALNAAFTPVAAALRGAWALQAGGVPEAPKKPEKKSGSRGRKDQPGMKIPPVAKYRKAYGMAPPEKGFDCLICEDTGRITAPGVSVACTECPGPAAAAMAAAERRAARVRAGRDSGRPR